MLAHQANTDFILSQISDGNCLQPQAYGSVDPRIPNPLFDLFSSNTQSGRESPSSRSFREVKNMLPCQRERRPQGRRPSSFRFSSRSTVRGGHHVSVLSPHALILEEIMVSRPSVKRKEHCFRDLSVGTSDLLSYDPCAEKVGRPDGKRPSENDRLIPQSHKRHSRRKLRRS
jgi:hypothetical protein